MQYPVGMNTSTAVSSVVCLLPRVFCFVHYALVVNPSSFPPFFEERPPPPRRRRRALYHTPYPHRRFR